MAKAMKTLERIPETKNLSCVPCVEMERPDFPCLYLDSKQMPEIDSWKVGEEYLITISVKMKSYSISDTGDKRSRAELSVESYERETKKSLS